MSASTPVVVVGAGACGLVAALAAAKQGAQVVLFEKAPTFDGNTVRSTGLIPAAGTRFQLAAGIGDDTPALMAHDILAKNCEPSDHTLTHTLCQAAGPTVEWLVDACGCDLICHTDVLYPGQSRLRMHGPPHGYGAALVAQLGAAVKADERITLRFAIPAQGLVFNDGHVVGVQLDANTVAAHSVVLALNGFGANRALVAYHLGAEVANALYFGSPHNTGEGIAWGVAAGAATKHMGAYQGHASVVAPDGPLVTWGVVVNGAILVNQHGERFGNELVGYSEFAEQVIAQPGGLAWEIFDQRVYDASCSTRFGEVIAVGAVVHGDTLDALAQAFGLPSTTLAATIAASNRAAQGAIADPWGRQAWGYAPLQPPFCGVPVRGALFHTQGGLCVNHDAQVLREDGSPIKGLYAGGGTAVGVSGPTADGYSSGNGLLAAVVLGRIAGEQAGRDTV